MKYNIKCPKCGTEDFVNSLTEDNKYFCNNGDCSANINMNILTKLEVINFLLNNKCYKAINDKGTKIELLDQYPDKSLIIESVSKRPLILEFRHDEKWRVVRPTLKKMCFGEMSYILSSQKTDFKLENCTSLVSGLNYSRSHNEISLDEFKGSWVMEGIYE